MRLIGLLTVGILCGCSAGKPATPIDEHHIRTLVSYVAEYHANFIGQDCRNLTLDIRDPSGRLRYSFLKDPTMLHSMT